MSFCAAPGRCIMPAIHVQMDVRHCTTSSCCITAVLIARGPSAQGEIAGTVPFPGSMCRCRENDNGRFPPGQQILRSRFVAPQMFVQLGNLRGEDGEVPPLSLTNDVDLVTLYRALSAPTEAT